MDGTMQTSEHTRRWPWFIAAGLVLATYLAETFLSTLGSEDWRQCFQAMGNYLRPHRFPVRDYPWASRWREFAWAATLAAPALVGLIVLRSRWVAGLCVILLAPLVWLVAIDAHLMLDQYRRGAVVTAQPGYHHCDRKGRGAIDLTGLWVYITTFIIACPVASTWQRRRDARDHVL
jgi:hypothetical protein